MFERLFLYMRLLGPRYHLLVAIFFVAGLLGGAGWWAPIVVPLVLYTVPYFLHKVFSLELPQEDRRDYKEEN